LTCREFAEFIADYLSGDLAPDVRAGFEAHLAVCANCQKYLLIYRDTSELGRHAFDARGDSLPGDVPADLVEAILAARRRSR